MFIKSEVYLSKLIKHIENFLLENISLHDFIYNLNGDVKERLMNILKAIAIWKKEIKA